MAKKKDNSVEELGDTGLIEETPETSALEEPTAENTTTEEEATATKEESAGKNQISVTTADVPQVENLQPGDTIQLVVDFKLVRKDEETGEYILEPIDYVPKEEMTSPTEETEQTGVGNTGVGNTAGGGLANLL